MTSNQKVLDYKALGLKCGLEVHQQLNTKKLFCSCATTMLERGTPLLVIHKQRAVAGESGAVDVAAAAETARDRTFVYQSFPDESCLVDLDEEPPHAINKEAFLTALSVASLLHFWIPDEIQVMRKTIADGSVSSSFQRTALVGIESASSFLETSEGHVKLCALSVEEDSCKIVEQGHERVTYSLSRQGVPLLEISTGPDIVSPAHMQEVAEKIGLILRSFSHVKRGLGTIRQDVNVSLREGARVEVKGAQDLKSLGLVVSFEAQRQHTLIGIKHDLWKRGVRTLLAEVQDVTSCFDTTQAKLIRRSLDEGNVVFGVCLKGFSGLLGRETQPGRRFGSELSDYAKIASGVGGIFHSDELPKYGISPEEVSWVRTALSCSDADAFVIVSAPEGQATAALEAVVLRARLAISGVPSEVRKAQQDGTSTYMRPMPGAARMYPETDVPAIRVTEKLLSSVEKPVLIEDRIVSLKHLGLALDLAEKLAKSRRYELFRRIYTAFPLLKASFVAEILVSAEKQLKRNFNIDVRHSDDEYFILFSHLAHEKIAKDSVLTILGEVPVIRAHELERYQLLDDDAVRKCLQELVSSSPDMPFKGLIGKAMEVLRGKADGKKIVQILKQLKEE